jgi:hypothetical protein
VQVGQGRARRGRRVQVISVVLAFATSAACANSAFASSTSASSKWAYPDLVPHEVGRMQISVEELQGQPHQLLRLDAYLENAGVGPLEFVGTNPTNASGEWRMTDVRQRIYRKGDRTNEHMDLPKRPGQELFYQSSPAHQHWHLRTPSATS